MIRQRAKLTPHCHIFCIRIGRLSEGNAVLRSTQSTNNLRLCRVRESIRAMSKATASLQPVSFRNPNCSGPGSQHWGSFLSNTLPNQAANELISRIPRKLVASFFGLPGLSKALSNALPQVSGYILWCNMKPKHICIRTVRAGSSHGTSDGIPSGPGDLPLRIASLAVSVSLVETSTAPQVCEVD